MPNAPEPKKSTPMAVVAFVIAVAALIGFIVLNKKMAPPFPNFPAKGGTNQVGTTNAPAEKQ
jgi:hypothetical protein